MLGMVKVVLGGKGEKQTTKAVWEKLLISEKWINGCLGFDNNNNQQQ